jgi:hypothetical protein
MASIDLETVVAIVGGVEEIPVWRATRLRPGCQLQCAHRAAVAGEGHGRRCFRESVTRT